MAKVEMLRELMNGRLTAVVEEICALFETTIAEYEEKLHRSNVGTEQPERLTPAGSDGGRSPHPEIQGVLLIKEEQQHESSGLGQSFMEPLRIKKEIVGPWSVLDGHRLEQPDCPSILTDTQQVMSTNQAPSKQQKRRHTRKDKDQRPPQANEDQETTCTLSEEVTAAEENRNSECPGSSSAEQMEIDEEDCNRAALQTDSAKASNSSEYETEDSDDDWKRTPAQQSNFNLVKNTEGPTSKEIKNLVSNCELKSGNDSSEPETEDSDDDNWNCRGKPQSGLSCVKPAEVPGSPSKSSCQTSCSVSVHDKGFQLKQQVGKRTKRKEALTKSKSGSTANSKKPSNPKKLLNHSSALKTHKTKELEKTSFLCSVCDKIFKKKTYLVSHMKMHKAAWELKAT